jgi:peptidoglycan hydrolase CwlO-like protein
MMISKLLAAMIMALITNLAFGASLGTDSVKTGVQKAGGKVKGIKNDTQAVRKDVQDTKMDTRQVSKDLRQLRR